MKNPDPADTAPRDMPDPRDIQTDDERMADRGRASEDGGVVVVRGGKSIFVMDV